MEDKQKKFRNSREQRSKYVQFSGLAIQIVVMVVLGVLAGKWLDEKMGNVKPLATIFFTLFSIIASLYYLVKKVK
jgi:F0F1-type ATP synthase assembly protein I